MYRRRVKDDALRQLDEGGEEICRGSREVLQATGEKKQIAGARILNRARERQAPGLVPLAGDLLAPRNDARNVAYLPAQVLGVAQVLAKGVVLESDVAADVEH